MSVLKEQVSSRFWIKRALEKSLQLLNTGIPPLPEERYQHRFQVLEVDDKIQKEEARHPGQITSRQLSIISEGLVCDLINRGLIFGQDCQAVKTNSYDDYINHIDLIVRFQNQPVEFLGIDVTYGINVPRKFLRLRREILNGTLGRLDYAYAGAKPTYLLPKLILGISQRNLTRLSQQWINDYEGLATSNMLAHFQLQIKKQLENYLAFALDNGKKEIAQIFRELISQLDFSITVASVTTYPRDNISSLIITQSILTGTQTAQQ